MKAEEYHRRKQRAGGYANSPGIPADQELPPACSFFTVAADYSSLLRQLLINPLSH
jgi:hypothetical protein